MTYFSLNRYKLYGQLANEQKHLTDGRQKWCVKMLEMSILQFINVIIIKLKQ